MFELPKFVPRTVVTRRKNVRTGYIKTVGVYDPNDLVLLDDTLTTFSPDLRKKPIRDRIKRTIEWASVRLELEEFTEASPKVYGMFNKNEEVGAWLRDLLLIEVQIAINGLRVPATYRINRNGYEQLLEIRKEIERYDQ